MLKPLPEIEAMEDGETDIFLHNIIDYYTARPVLMTSMSLHYFASWFIKCPTPASQSARSLERIYIEKCDIWIRKRRLSAIVRFPCFSVSNDDYYFSLVVLLLPFRSESDLFGEFPTANEAVFAKYAFIDFSVQMHNSFLHQVENSIRRIRLAEAELEEQTNANNLPTDSTDIGLNNSTISAPNLYVSNISTSDAQVLPFY